MQAAKRVISGCLALLRQTRGSVALLFALSIVPVMLIVGFSIDYAMYIKAESQLNLAADASALYAARFAASAYGNKLATTTAAATAAAQTAGTAWFNAQLGNLPNVTIPAGNLSVQVTYTAAPSQFKATVTYSGTVKTVFAGMFSVASLPVSGLASSVVTNAYVEVVMLIDNSSSMLIGASNSDILTLEQATMCSTQAANGQSMPNYSWIYPTSSPSYGYGSGYKTPPTTVIGNCDPNYTGPSSLCFYPSAMTSIINSSGKCVAGSSHGVSGVPQAPCAFACHNDASSNDYYGLARSLNISLRLDVVLSAAENVISTLQTEEQTPGQFLVGVYQFNSALEPVYPSSGSAEAGTDLATALSLTKAITTPVTLNSANTDFVDSAASLASRLSASGNGGSPSQPTKNLFIVTDGIEDTGPDWNRVYEAMNSSDETNVCQQFKALGFTVYVLYTPYLPLPNPFYLYGSGYGTTIKSIAEGTPNSPVVTALQSCASASSDFYEASDSASINAALQSMVKSAMDSAGRIAQ